MKSRKQIPIEIKKSDKEYIVENTFKYSLPYSLISYRDISFTRKFYELYLSMKCDVINYNIIVFEPDSIRIIYRIKAYDKLDEPHIITDFNYIKIAAEKINSISEYKDEIFNTKKIIKNIKKDILYYILELVDIENSLFQEKLLIGINAENKRLEKIRATSKLTILPQSDKANFWFCH